MPQYLSPGVFVTENDISGYVPQVSTSVGALVFYCDWGPAYQVQTLSTAKVLVQTFGPPTDSNFENWFTAWNFLSYSTTLRLVRAISRSTSKNATADGAGLLINHYDSWLETYSTGTGNVGAWAARYPSALGNSLYISICGPGAAYNGAPSRTVTSNAGNATLTFSANVMSDTVRPLVVGDRIRIGANTDWLKVIAIDSTGNTVTVNNATAVVTSVANNIVAQWEFAPFFSIAPSTSDKALEVGGANDEVHVVVVDRAKAFSTTANNILEKYAHLSVASDVKSGPTSMYYADYISNKSSYIYWMAHRTGATNWGNSAVGNSFTVLTSPYSVKLAGGVHSVPANSDVIEGYNLFNDPDSIDVSLFMTGNNSTTVKTYVLDNIVGSRKDSVVFMGPERSDVVLKASASVAHDAVISRYGNYSSTSYGFFVDNWMYQYDIYNDTYRWVPLDGSIAGIAAASDSSHDAWWSFAGFNRGQIKNCVKLAWKSDEGLRNDMYPLGINSIVTFQGEGTYLMGDRTMQRKPSAFDRINVRRLFITLEKAIKKAAKYLLFEFNDAFTRAQFVALVEPYLRDVRGRRGIYDYRVICDETNNTGEIIDNNKFVGDIYIKPAKSINFLQLNFTAVGTDVIFEEVAGQIGV